MTTHFASHYFSYISFRCVANNTKMRFDTKCRERVVLKCQLGIVLNNLSNILRKVPGKKVKQWLIPFKTRFMIWKSQLKFIIKNYIRKVLEICRVTHYLNTMPACHWPAHCVRMLYLSDIFYYQC